MSVLLLVLLAFVPAAQAKPTLYVGGVFGPGVGSFEIAANGGLTKNTTTPEPVTEATNGVALTPDGRHLFATSAGFQAIFTYDVNANGSLLSTGKANLVGPPDPDVDGVAISPDGSHLYTA